MGDPRWMNDWELEDEIGLGRGVLVVGFLTRLDPRHRRFARKVAELSFHCEDPIRFRLVDLAEHPSLLQKLALEITPALAVYIDGIRKARWEGNPDMRRVGPAVQALIKSTLASP